MRQNIRFAACGDLLMTSEDGINPGRGFESISKEILDIFKSCDIVFANLECTLRGKEKISTEPRVISTRKQVASLGRGFVNIVSLANNHSFDCLEDGFSSVKKELSELGISFGGAGFNLEEAVKPVIMVKKGVVFAFLFFAHESTGTGFFAGEKSFGSADFDVERICSQIGELKKKADHVIVSPHWGYERFEIPEPGQMESARKFIDAGASMVIGHHPHVIQGMENYKEGVIAYSLGNFFSSRVFWENGDFLDWNRFERTGTILLGEINKDSIVDITRIPIFDDGSKIEIDSSEFALNSIKRVDSKIKKGVGDSQFAMEKLRRNVLRPVLAKMNFQDLKKIRPYHFKKFAELLLREKRS